MTPETIRRINDERLGAWREDLVAVHATPALLIGVGHDAAIGQVHLCMPENMPKEILLSYLAFAFEEIQSRP